MTTRIEIGKEICAVKKRSATHKKLYQKKTELIKQRYQRSKMIDSLFHFLCLNKFLILSD
ncbi:hypothetical protein GCM10023206_28640 [Acinetobacter puyangensis]